MTATIALCQSSAKATTPSFENITINQLLPLIKNVEVGTKDGSYFLRTGVIDTSMKRRLSSNTTSMASVLIIDADSTVDNDGVVTVGAPCPYAVHDNLKEADINHLIYSTHSHTTKGNRYRILFWTDKPYNKSELSPTVSHALLLCGGQIADVTENHTWAQAWYIPRKAHDTSEVIQLAYADGKALPVQQPLPDITTCLQQPTRKPVFTNTLNPINAYNAQYTIEQELLARGDKLQGKAWLYFNSTSNEAGIHIQDNKMYSHHGSDDLCDGFSHGSFDVMQSRLALSYNDAIKYAAKVTFTTDGKTLDAANKANYKTRIANAVGGR